MQYIHYEFWLPWRLIHKSIPKVSEIKNVSGLHFRLWNEVYDKTNVNAQQILLNLTKSYFLTLALPLLSSKCSKNKQKEQIENKMTKEQVSYSFYKKDWCSLQSHLPIFSIFVMVTLPSCHLFLKKLPKIIKDYIWEKESGLCSLLDKVRDGLCLSELSQWAFVLQGITCHLYNSIYHSMLTIHILNSEWTFSPFKDSADAFSS